MHCEFQVPEEHFNLQKWDQILNKTYYFFWHCKSLKGPESEEEIRRRDASNHFSYKITELQTHPSSFVE